MRIAPMSKKDEKPTINADRSKYTVSRNAAGKKSLHNGDAVAVALDGFDLDTTRKIAAEVSGVEVKTLADKYAHLNGGQNRMNLGNVVRGAVRRMEKEKEGSGIK